MKTLFQTMDTLERAMSFHRERHIVLAGNVANVDTPGYRPYDLSRTQGIDAKLELLTTNRAHLPGASSAGTTLSFDDSGATQGADGNSVNLDRELAKIDANRTRYTTGTELLSRRAALLRYSASDGGN
jgi:flagellar basal-body rod protein FlgB